MTSKSTEGSSTHWVAPSTTTVSSSLEEINALCLGTGRFLRSVLVPALVGSGHTVGLIQTRGRSFLESLHHQTTTTTTNSNQINININNDDGTYEVDTVEVDGSISTSRIPVQAAFSLGRPDDKAAVFEALTKMQGISILGIGVTEAGLVNKDTQAMKDLFEILCTMARLITEGQWKTHSASNRSRPICILDMDNVPYNGDLLRTFMGQHAAACDDHHPNMTSFLETQVVFCNTMVDRITSQRPGSGGLVPRCEPTPAKALVICDPSQALPSTLREQPGVVVRSSRAQLDMDIALKLRIANGTHTAIAHTLALRKHLLTDALSPEASSSSTSTSTIIYLRYLDALVQHQILPGCPSEAMRHEGGLVWADWRQRLTHAHFGLSSFFITQNGTAKGGIRWGPTVVDLVQQQQQQQNRKAETSPAKLQVSMAFAYAILLRWLTPISQQPPQHTTKEGVYTGLLDGADPSSISPGMMAADVTSGTVEYADGLSYNLEQGWYEYRCPLAELVTQLSECMENRASIQPGGCLPVIRSYLTNPQGGDLASIAATAQFEELVATVGVLYARLVAGDSVQAVLEELDASTNGVEFTSPCGECGAMVESSMTAKARRRRSLLVLHYQPLLLLPDNSHLMNASVDETSVAAVVTSEVGHVQVIDLHTHLLPPTHGALCLWGIDELLTYHYLVAEYFMTAPASITPEDFFASSKQDQADLIWKALFVDRSPLSEACRGVLTTLFQLGLGQEVAARDLAAIRHFYRLYSDRGATGAEAFCERIFALSGIDYAIMTNIPFDMNEAQYWCPHRIDYSKRYRSALRVDPLLAGDRGTIEAALKSSGYDPTIEAARQYLRDWCDTMNPEYMMASTPHDFVLREGTLEGVQKRGMNEETLKQPGMFANVANIDHVANCDGTEDEAPSVIDETSDFVGHVLMTVCEERDLPLALKIGAHRGVNPKLKAAGDGVVAFADAGLLGRLCSRFPKVRFLATFLSRNNQHEACVLANKFRNLHIYGCWWFCNNPSIIREITTMRVEMLGTAFTAQHSDARVFDQLCYKWGHSRAIIAEVLISEYSKSIESGWIPTRAEIRRDVRRLFRGSYEEFMAKSLV